MKFVFIFILVLSVSIPSFAQVYQNVNAGGGKNNVRAKSSNTDVEGSFYLFDNWKQGKISFEDGSAEQTVDVKFDLFENLLVIKGEGDVENVFSSPIAYFSILDGEKWMSFKKGFQGPDLNKDIFVQVLYSGTKVSFFKREVKTIIESKGYNTATVTKKVANTTLYYIKKDETNNLFQVKRDVKSLANTLQNSELESFAKKNKLNLKKDEDLIKLFSFYEML